MVEAKEAILTVLNIDYENETDNWDSYDRSTVKIADRDDYKGTSQANYDNILIKDTEWLTGYPGLCLERVDGSDVVRVDIRSTNKARIKLLKAKVISIISNNLTNLTSPWHYMVLLNRGVPMSRGKNYRYVVEIKLHIVDEILS